MTLDELAPNQPFEIGQRYYAKVEAIGVDGSESAPIAEMNFDIIKIVALPSDLDVAR